MIPGLASEHKRVRSERRDVREHRQAILSAARALFAEKGVDAVSMHQIARAAGVGQGTLYRRYAHKGLLCLGLLEEGMQTFQEEVQVYLEQAGTSLLILEQLTAVFTQLIRFNEDNAPLLGAMTDAACGNRRTDSFRSPFYLWLRQVVYMLLQQAVERKEIAVPDLEYTVDVLLAPLAIDFYLYQRHVLGFTQERIVAGIQRIVMQGLAGTH